VKVSQVVDDRARVQRDAADLTTAELVTIMVRGSLTRADQEATAVAIDGVKLSRATRLPNRLCGLADLPAAASEFLAALLELARRAALAPPPMEIRGPADVALIAQRELGGRRRERMLAIACDAANRMLRTEIVSRGSTDRAPVPVREILSAVLLCDGRAFAVAHNHPGGVLEPTDADVAATERLASGARAVGVRFLGHVVVAENAWTTVAIRPQRTLD
jgi:DNA repair protein RadC